MKIGPATQGVLLGIALSAVGVGFFVGLIDLVNSLHIGTLGGVIIIFGTPITIALVVAIIVDNRKRRPGC